MRAKKSPAKRVHSFAKLLDNAHDAILAMDPGAVIRVWNGGAERLYGWSKKEAIGTRSHELLRTVFPIPLQDIERLMSEHGEWTGELVHFTRDGRKLTVSTRWVATKDKSGAATGFLEVNRDITDKKRLQESLSQAQRLEAIGRLAGGVAHDFNNLLTVIAGYAASLRAKMGPESPYWAAISEIERAAGQAALLTGQLLAFSRNQPVHFEALDLNHVITNVKQIVTRLIGEDIDVDVILDSSHPCVRGDAGQLTQVLMNLAANGRDAMPTGGKLAIKTEVVVWDPDRPGMGDSHPAGRYAVLSVTDTGAGMDALTRARVFEPFFTTKEPGKGTGLGLSTTYGIVQEHGGWIDVYSERGYGTSFRIFLPAVSAEVAVVAEQAPLVAPQRFGTILLVEDQAAIRMLAQDVLEEVGHRVLTAADGLSALRVAEKEETIDLLVTDIVMPNLGGPQLADLLTRARPELRVLYTSGYTGHALVHAGTLDSSADFLHKPFTPDELVRKVDQALARGRTTTAGRSSS